MNKKGYGIIGLTLLLSTLLGVSSFYAQESDDQDLVTQAENDYRSSYDTYRISYKQYQVAKSEWQKSNTIVAEQEAVNATKEVAIDRDELQVKYLLWIAARLASLMQVYPDADTFVGGTMKKEIDWFRGHQKELVDTTTLTNTDTLMSLYYQRKKTRDNIFAMAQIHLKLAQLSSYQHQARSLYTPVLNALEERQEPEIKQTLTKITGLGEAVNNQILATQNIIGSLESGDFDSKQAFQRASDSLEIIRSKQIELLTLMNELDQRYVSK